MWQTPPDILKLPSNEVHVWKVNSGLHEQTILKLSEILSKDELLRASKFRFNQDRNTFLVARSVLRKLLGSYLQKSPDKITFHYNEQGKPFIENEVNIKFNVSHSEGMIVLGFALAHDIGIDVEYRKKVVGVERIAKSFFSHAEVNDLLNLPEEHRLEAFYNCWTRKEAFIKAKGGGLSIPLDQFQVTLKPEEDPELKFVHWDINEVKQWQLESFNTNEDYLGALIKSNTISHTRYYTFSV